MKIDNEFLEIITPILLLLMIGIIVSIICIPIEHYESKQPHRCDELSDGAIVDSEISGVFTNKYKVTICDSEEDSIEHEVVVSISEEMYHEYEQGEIDILKNW